MKEKKGKMKGGKYFIKLINEETYDLPIQSTAFSEIDSNSRNKFIESSKNIAHLGQIDKVLVESLENTNATLNEFNDSNPNILPPKQITKNLQQIYIQVWNEIYNLKNTSSQIGIQTKELSNQKVATNNYFETAFKKIDSLNYINYEEFKNERLTKTKFIQIIKAISKTSNVKDDPFQCMAKGYDELLK